MTELSYFTEPDRSRTGAAPPPDTLVALLELPRTHPARAEPLPESFFLDLTANPAVVVPVAERLRVAAAVSHARIRSLRALPQLRVGLVVGAGLLGCAPSIGTLLSDARAERPGGRLLVALLAGAAVLGLRARRPFREPDIHDRDVDWLLALPLLMVAGFFVTSVASRIGPTFGARHLSLLTVPVLVAAATIIGFGTRAMWRLRLPLTLLLLALLPLPGHWQAGPVAVTSRLLRDAVSVLAAAGLPVQPIDPTPWLTGVAGVVSLLVALILLSAVVRPVAPRPVAARPVTARAGRIRTWVVLGARLLPVALAWLALTAARAALVGVLAAHDGRVASTAAGIATGVVADLVVCLVVLATAATVVRRVGRARPAPGSGRLAPLTRCLDITALRLMPAPGGAPSPGGGRPGGEAP